MTSRSRLPNRRHAEIFQFEYEGLSYRATFGRFADGRLGEVFLDVGKPNAQIQVHADTSAMLTSLLLQHGVHPRVITHTIAGPIAVALSMVAP
jgi:ribonucleoside-diphosphate reductase alpha chain